MRSDNPTPTGFVRNFVTTAGRAGLLMTLVLRHARSYAHRLTGMSEV